MPIEYIYLPENDGMTFEEFLDKYNITIVVREIPHSEMGGDRLLKYHAYSKENIEVKYGMLRWPVTGGGDTPEIALEDLMVRWTGQLLVRNDEEFYAPNEWRKS